MEIVDRRRCSIFPQMMNSITIFLNNQLWKRPFPGHIVGWWNRTRFLPSRNSQLQTGRWWTAGGTRVRRHGVGSEELLLPTKVSGFVWRLWFLNCFLKVKHNLYMLGKMVWEEGYKEKNYRNKVRAVVKGWVRMQKGKLNLSKRNII